MVINFSTVIVKKNRRVLLVQPPRGIWAGQWCLPGGKVEHGESYEQAGIRELKEETGFVTTKVAVVGDMSFVVEDRHYLGVVFLALDPKQSGAGDHLQKWVKQSRPGRVHPPLREFIDRYPRIWLAGAPEIKFLGKLYAKTRVH